MAIAEKLDEYGKGAWIGLTIVGFWMFWPIGLAMLIFLMCSGRTRAWKCESRGRWYNMERTGGGGWGRGSRPSTSGNAAFDEYKTQTLKRLEDEQKEFVEYLEKLRAAKDKSEFDQFMADRRDRPAAAA